MGKKKSLTRGERNIKFIETCCVVPEGSKVGKQVKLAKFQKKFILALYDNPHITDTAILSIARKNAKTGTIAFIVILHLVGPEAVQNSRIISGAMSRDQAAEVYNLASKCVAMSPKLSGRIRAVPSGKKLIGLAMNVEYQAISADAHTAHGKSPIVAIMDEVGQISGPSSDFVDAIETAQGAYDEALMIYISTQAANDSDFLSILIDDAEKNKPPHTVCHVYETPMDAPLLDEESWQLSNPALGLFRSMRDMRKQAAKAARMPSFENTFRNLNLNQRISRNSPFISRTVWKKCGGNFLCKNGEGFVLEDCEEIYGGLDLSKRTDLTAFILIGRIGTEWYVFCWFWTPEKGLHDRAKKDRAPYDVWHKQGYLLTTPGATVDYEYVAKAIEEITSPVSDRLVAIAFDRWRMDVMQKELDKLGVELPMVGWGQGFKDMAPALDAVEEKLLNKVLHHGDNPVLTMCAANAVVTQDPAGNRKLDKLKTSGRIDGMVAMAMAAGVAERNHELDGDLDDFINDPVSI